ncbi:hypothetical protein LPJ60_002017 [Coemansia sp. RSA 2675]|nr:hypothetical protein LPJ60_002017 [Coemansia sp. RSA 2675]
MSLIFSILLALLCVLYTASAQLTSDSSSATSSFTSEKLESGESSLLASLGSQASRNSSAGNIIGGVLAVTTVVLLMGSGVGYLLYRRYAKKRAALDEKAAMSDSISEAKTLV